MSTPREMHTRSAPLPLTDAGVLTTWIICKQSRTRCQTIRGEHCISRGCISNERRRDNKGICNDMLIISILAFRANLEMIFVCSPTNPWRDRDRAVGTCQDDLKCQGSFALD
ncbi:Uncharacterized protein HZ326_6582 [Fusarium oxysporum f. sp. albedinis]|nr:Uncharacterized protein HZ326_6582 [Fusarium oxysporum f. sp. albedinis]